MVVLPILLGVLLKRDSLIIDVSNLDLITETHVISVLKRHGIAAGVMTSITTQIVATGAPSDLTAILDDEAPADSFNLSIPGKRTFSKTFMQTHRISLSRKDIDGTGHSPFNVKALSLILKTKPELMASVSYMPRPYLGPDLQYHVGFDIIVTSKDEDLGFDSSSLSANLKLSRCQILDPDCKEFYILPAGKS